MSIHGNRILKLTHVKMGKQFGIISIDFPCFVSIDAERVYKGNLLHYLLKQNCEQQ